jgi:hypothetical protein
LLKILSDLSFPTCGNEVLYISHLPTNAYPIHFILQKWNTTIFLSQLLQIASLIRSQQTFVYILKKLSETFPYVWIRTKERIREYDLWGSCEVCTKLYIKVCSEHFYQINVRDYEILSLIMCDHIWLCSHQIH